MNQWMEREKLPNQLFLSNSKLCSSISLLIFDQHYIHSFLNSFWYRLFVNVFQSKVTHFEGSKQPTSAWYHVLMLMLMLIPIIIRLLILILMPNSTWSLSLEFQFPIDDSLSYWTTISLDIEHWASSYTMIWVEFVRITSSLDIKN